MLAARLVTFAAAGACLCYGASIRNEPLEDSERNTPTSDNLLAAGHGPAHPLSLSRRDVSFERNKKLCSLCKENVRCKKYGKCDLCEKYCQNAGASAEEEEEKRPTAPPMHQRIGDAVAEEVDLSAFELLATLREPELMRSVLEAINADLDVEEGAVDEIVVLARLKEARGSKTAIGNDLDGNDVAEDAQAPEDDAAPATARENAGALEDLDGGEDAQAGKNAAVVADENVGAREDAEGSPGSPQSETPLPTTNAPGKEEATLAQQQQQQQQPTASPSAPTPTEDSEETTERSSEERGNGTAPGRPAAPGSDESDETTEATTSASSPADLPPFGDHLDNEIEENGLMATREREPQKKAAKTPTLRQREDEHEPQKAVSDLLVERHDLDEEPSPTPPTEEANVVLLNNDGRRTTPSPTSLKGAAANASSEELTGRPSPTRLSDGQLSRLVTPLYNLLHAEDEAIARIADLRQAIPIVEQVDDVSPDLENRGEFVVEAERPGNASDSDVVAEGADPIDSTVASSAVDWAPAPEEQRPDGDESRPEYFGKLLPAREKSTFVAPGDDANADKQVYFVGNGVRLPLQMRPDKDGALQLTVDVDRLCGCKEKTCGAAGNSTEEVEDSARTKRSARLMAGAADDGGSLTTEIVVGGKKKAFGKSGGGAKDEGFVRQRLGLVREVLSWMKSIAAAGEKLS